MNRVVEWIWRSTFVVGTKKDENDEHASSARVLDIGRLLCHVSSSQEGGDERVRWKTNRGISLKVRLITTIQKSASPEYLG